MYDWANSAFATTVMAGFFPVFFKEYVMKGADPVVSTARLGFANSVAGVIVVLATPFLGAVADSGSMKKRLLSLFLFIGGAGALWFVDEESGKRQTRDFAERLWRRSPRNSRGFPVPTR